VTSDDDVGSWEVLDAIESLVAKSMVNAEDRSGATRYSMLETLRSYARERLESGGEADEWRRRQAEHFVVFADRAGRGLKGADEIEWFGRIRDELDNLRTAVFWSLDAAVDHSHALEIISSLAMLATLDRSTGLSGWADQAIDHLDETTPGRGAAILGAAAWYAYDRADFERSDVFATRALTGLYDPDCLAPTLTLILLGMRGTSTGAEIMAELREHMARLDAADASETDQSIFRAAVATMCIFFPDEAANVGVYAQQGFALAQSSGNPSALASGYFALGHALAADGDHDAARAAHESSIALTRGGASDGVYPHALRFAARACFNAGDFEAAAEHSRAAIEHADRTGDLPTLRYALDESTFILVREGRFEAAAMILGNGDSGEISRWNMPWDATGIEESEQQILAELGDEACDAARARGLAMNQREIVAFTLNELSALDTHP
jgi:tetratricopeptide (TPR) repeat protein